MFPPLCIPFEYWIEHETFGLLYVTLDSLVGNSTEEFEALQLIVLSVFGAVD